MGFMCFVKWKTPLGSTTFRWMLNDSMPSKCVASTIITELPGAFIQVVGDFNSGTFS